MGGAFRIGRIAGIDLKIHWTFFLLLIWIGGSYLARGATASAAAIGVISVIAIFGCVVLHELGHALAARRYGISTHDITLLPIGGVARLQEIPERPWREFVVAVAGPLVNVIIAVAIGAGLLITQQSLLVAQDDLMAVSLPAFFRNLLWVNLFLVVFNAIPAFPMDGGRVLRALLATGMPRVRATDIAASVGKMLAIVFGIVGVMWNPFLLLIAVFVYLGANAEQEQVRVKSLIGDLPVRAAMIARFRRLLVGETLVDAREALLAGMQQDFPVVDDLDTPLGMVFRRDLIEAFKQMPMITAMGEISKPVDQYAVAPGSPLREAMMKMQEQQIGTLPVLNGSVLVGIVTLENIVELLALREADPGFLSPAYAISKNG